jgi:hypothetical protein
MKPEHKTTILVGVLIVYILITGCNNLEPSPSTPVVDNKKLDTVKDTRIFHIVGVDLTNEMGTPSYHYDTWFEAKDGGIYYHEFTLGDQSTGGKLSTGGEIIRDYTDFKTEIWTYRTDANLYFTLTDKTVYKEILKADIPVSNLPPLIIQNCKR